MSSKKSAQKGRYVASRHKQAAASYSGSRISKNETILEKSSSDSSNDTLALNSTVDPKGGTSVGSNKLDMSEIGPSTLSVPTIKVTEASCGKTRMEVLAAKMESLTCSGAHSSASLNKRKKKHLSKKQLDDEMDIVYAEYLQAAYLQSEAKKAFEANSKSALEKLYRLWCQMQSLLHQCNKWQIALLNTECVIENHKSLQKREEMLKPLVEIIPVLEKQYESITAAVNAVKHKVQIKNIDLPKPGSEDDILDCLQKIEASLNEIVKNVPNMDELNSSADNLDTLTCNEELVVENLKRGFEMISMLRKLILQESSLK